MNEVCKAQCTYPCHRTDGYNIWGTEIYTYESRICKAAVHSFHISTWNISAKSILFKRIPYHSRYHGSVRFGFNSLPFGTLGSPERGSFIFINPKISEEILDIVSIHFDYLFEVKGYHTQQCIVSTNAINQNVTNDVYINGNSVPSSTDKKVINIGNTTRYQVVWLGSLSESSAGGYQCTPQKSMLSTPISIAMRRQADFFPPCLTVTASLHDNVTLSMQEAQLTGYRTKWLKDKLQLNPYFSSIQARNNLTLFNIDVGSSGIYSLEYVLSGASWKRGIVRLIVRACIDGFFGDNCTEECPHCLHGGICHDITGVCICPPGFHGIFCEQTCPPGYFGMGCTMTCQKDLDSNSSCENVLICLPDPFGCSCAAGFKGLSCNMTCERGTFGANCNQIRDCHCSNNESCDIFSGTCEQGCMEGWHGTHCTLSYPYLKDPPSIINVTKHSITLSFPEWDPVNGDGIGSPMSYLVVYKVNNQTFGAHVSSSNRSEYNIDLGNLEAGHTYSVSIVIVDESRSIQSSLAKAVNVSTLCDKPGAPPTNIELQATENIVTVKWGLPERDSWNCEKVVVIIKYSSAINSGQMQFNETSRNMVSFHSKPFTLWNILMCLTAAPEHGNNVEPMCSEEFNVTTEESAPEKVRQIVSNVIDSQTAMISWNEPAVTNGRVRYYHLLYSPMEWVHPCTVPFNETPTEISAGSTFFVVDKLRPSVAYSMSISAVTTEAGPFQTVFFQTKGDVPDGIPQNLSFSENSYLKWKEPLCNTSNGDINCYSVYVVGFEHWDMSQRNWNITSTQYTLMGLLPFTKYLVRIAAGNQYGFSKNFAELYFTTEPSVPLPVSEARIYSRFSDALYLSWLPPYPPHGHLSHYIIIYSSVGDSHEVGKHLSVTDAACKDVSCKKCHCFSVAGLKSNRIYNFKIRAFNKGIIQGSQTVLLSGETSESIPEAPTSAVFHGRTNKSISIKWEKPMVTNGNITNYRINLTLVQPFRLSGVHFSPSVISVESSKEKFSFDNLNPATKYSVCIEARTKMGYGKPICEIFNTSNSVPVLNSSPKFLKTTDKEVFLEIPFVKLSEGPISAYFVVVDPLKRNHREKRSESLKLFKPHNCNSTSGPFKAMYVALKVENIPNTGLNVTVGNGSCYNGYFNAELEYGMLYKIGMAVLSVYGKDEKYSDIKFIEEPILIHHIAVDRSSGHAETALGFLIPFLIIVAALIIIIYLRKPHWMNIEKHHKTLRMKILPFVEESNLGTLNEALEEEEEIATESVGNELSHPIVIDHLESYVCEGLSNGAMQQEFQSLPRGQKFPCSAAKIPENKIKNRYGNLFPYDHSRVILETLPDVSHSDFINANYINGYRKPQRYIATQGPKSLTVADFWRMVWQEKSCKIIMCTNILENGKVKCEKYWPDNHSDSPTVYGNFTVAFVHTEPYADFVIRTLILTKDQKSRTVKHFHFQAWPDHGVPAYSSSTTAFLKKVQDYESTDTAPIIVHCSAGIGRTGTFILLDSMIEMGQAEGCVDLLCHLNNMRACRSNIVENYEQYAFVYNALVETLCGVETCIPCSDVVERLKYLRVVDSVTGICLLEKEFQMLMQHQHRLSSSETKAACSPENWDKNRNPDILTIDRARPILQHSVDQYSNYINAVYVNGYRQRDAFIVTQYPLPHTSRDFWCMVYETKSRTIFLLNDIDFEDTMYPQYWPRKDGETLTFDKFEVKCQVVENDAFISTWSLVLSYQFDTEDQSFSLSLVQYHGCKAGDSVPVNPDSFLSLFLKYEKRQQQVGEHVIVVQCVDGASLCGVFCSLVFMIEKMKTEHDLDVFQAVKCIRVNRSQLIQAFDQYNFLYDAAITFLNLYDTYANFL